MSLKSILRSVAASGLVYSAIAAHASVLTTVDLSPIGGTSWSSLNSTPVRVDFGSGYGLGTISATSINGGYFQNYQTPYSGEPQSNLALGGGNSLDVTYESVFTIGHGTSPGGELAGFTISVLLDTGNFASGSLVNIRSLDWTGGNIHQYFSPGSMFATPYAAQLPTDFNTPYAAPNMLVGTDASGDLYGAAQPGVSAGLAFPLASATNAFTFRLLTTDYYYGGIAFSIAVPAASEVPEPQMLPLMLIGLGLLSVGLRRRRQPAAAAC